MVAQVISPSCLGDDGKIITCKEAEFEEKEVVVLTCHSERSAVDPGCECIMVLLGLSGSRWLCRTHSYKRHRPLIDATSTSTGGAHRPWPA